MINTLAIVVLIPMYDKLLVPGLRKLGRPITLLQRIGGCAVPLRGVAAERSCDGQQHSSWAAQKPQPAGLPARTHPLLQLQLNCTASLSCPFV
jgi:hypothetical protein